MVGSVFLLTLGSWFIITRHTNFLLGGRNNPTLDIDRPTLVRTSGLDAIAIGCAVIGIGVINLALGMRSRKRIPVFWVGAVLLVLPIVYGVGKFGLDVYQFITG